MSITNPVSSHHSTWTAYAKTESKTSASNAIDIYQELKFKASIIHRFFFNKLGKNPEIRLTIEIPGENVNAKTVELLIRMNGLNICIHNIGTVTELPCSKIEISRNGIIAIVEYNVNYKEYDALNKSFEILQHSSKNTTDFKPLARHISLIIGSIPELREMIKEKISSEIHYHKPYFKKEDPLKKIKAFKNTLTNSIEKWKSEYGLSDFSIGKVKPLCFNTATKIYYQFDITYKKNGKIFHIPVTTINKDQPSSDFNEKDIENTIESKLKDEMLWSLTEENKKLQNISTVSRYQDFPTDTEFRISISNTQTKYAKWILKNKNFELLIKKGHQWVTAKDF